MAADEAYRQAEERIEHARREKATELDLSSLGLTELPDSLGQLTQLQSLNVWEQPTDDAAGVAGPTHRNSRASTCRATN